MRKKDKKRHKLNQLRAYFHDGRPWSIMPTAYSAIEQAIEMGSLAAVQAALVFGEEDKTTTQIVNGTAVIPVTGVLTDAVDYMVQMGFASSYQLIEKAFADAMGSEAVKAVAFFIDSPGGSALGVKRAADAIFAARGSKPIVAYTQGICGSAAYYLAAACDRIDATADAMVGSIGTIYTHQQVAKMADEIGIGITVFTNEGSPKKGHGNQFEPLTSDAKKTLQDFTDSYGQGFIDDVARYRNLTPANVATNYGQGDAFRGDIAITHGMIDSIVANFSESLNATAGQPAATNVTKPPVVTGSLKRSEKMNVSKKIRAQLFALNLIPDMEASDEVCTAAIGAWCASRLVDSPSDEAGTLAVLQAVQTIPEPAAAPVATAAIGTPVTDEQGPVAPAAIGTPVTDEQGEARLEDLRASAALINTTIGRDAITDTMVLDAFAAGMNSQKAIPVWNAALAAAEPAIPSPRVTGEGSDRYAEDIIDALVYRSSDNPNMELSSGAASLVNRPLWAVAGECLQQAGRTDVDMYGSRELLAEEAMQMGSATNRTSFFSGNEDRRYVQASGGIPFARPGDFPNILSGLANKFLDMVELDDDYSYPEISALLPGGLNDFKPGAMMNKGVVEEMDEVQDAEQIKELGLAEEVLSYIFLRRFANSWGWTPVMVANDDLNAFSEGMLGLAEAWQVTQNRLVLDRFTANETLLDGSALFADRADVGSATNDNIAGSATPGDAQWGLMETAYADIGGVGTARRVRGMLNVALVPTGAASQNARRTFLTYPVIGETKEAATTANVGLYRGQVRVVPESELRGSSAVIWYGLRNPTRINNATVVRAYFNGFGTAGRRERWYDPTTKTTWVSLEGRIAVAVKNWRYAIRNAGA